MNDATPADSATSSPLLTPRVLIPLALRAAKVDPALSSSIFLTTVTDVAGFFFFLGLAALLIPLFGGI